MIRSHRKSRRGCAQCKARRVKCDETLPSCLRCTRRGDRCSYIDEYGLHTPLPQSPAASLPQTGQSPEPPAPSPPSSDRLDDIELTHIFLTRTYKTLWYREPVPPLWKGVAFEEALKEPALLGGILAISAMHVIATSDHPEKRYQVMALRNQAVALKGFVKLLPRITEETADAAFLLSVLVTHWAFASRNLPAELGIFSTTHDYSAWTFHETRHDKVSEVQDFVDIIRKTQPVRQLVFHGRPWLLGGKLAEMMKIPKSHELPALPPFVDQALDTLLLRAEQESCVLLPLEKNGRPLLSIKLVYRISMRAEWAEGLMGWITCLPPEFIAQLETGENMAMIMLSYWAVCMSVLDERWWATGWGYALVTEIANRVGPEWAELADWPVKNYHWFG